MEETSLGGVVAEESHPLAELMEQQPATEPEQAEETGQEEKEEKPAKVYSQDEVDRIVRKSKRNAAYLARKEAEAELYKRMSEERAAPVQKAEPTDAAPQRDAFETYEEYIEARAEWKAEQKLEKRLAEFETRRSQDLQQASVREQAERFEKTAHELAATVPDIVPTIEEFLVEAPLSQVMRQMILESESGALLTYHLAKNPAEASRISQLSPVQQVRALVRIEADLATTKAPRVSKAPDPIKPIGSGSSTSPDPAKMSMQDYTEWRRKQRPNWAR
jgi:hypothetical protein